MLSRGREVGRLSTGLAVEVAVLMGCCSLRDSGYTLGDKIG